MICSFNKCRLLVQEQYPECNTKGEGGKADSFCEEECSELVAAAPGHELRGGRGEDPVVPMEVGHIQVESLGYQGTGGYASPGATQRTRLAMTLMQHYRPCAVEISSCTEVDVGDYHVKEGSKMFMSSRACHEVVAGRNRKQVKDIGTDTLQECDSFLGGEGGKGGTRLGQLNDVAEVL